MNRFVRTLIACLLATAGCAAETEEISLAGDDFALAGGKADGGDDIVIRDYRGGNLVTLYGSAAAGMWGILEDVGYPVTDRGTVEVVRSQYVVCITNRSAAACQLWTPDVSSVDGFDLAIHGRRFNSASSDLFGAMAALNDVRASRVTSVEYGDYVCEKGRSTVWCGLSSAGDDTVELEVSLVGLGDLGPDYVYEGWLITSEGPVTSGRFGLDSDDDMRTFTVDRAIVEDATMFVLTIEPAIGDDPGPADTHVVAGVFDGATAALDTMHPAALATDFTEASGSYILETPSSAASDDYNQGVWFVDPAAGAPSLDLPALPAGWVYEGWVVGADGPVSTGTFTSAMGADSDAGGPTAGPGATPPFPGQDFVTPPRDLIGGAVVISVEPSPDNGAGPFFLKPLVDGSAEDVGPGMLQSMGNNAAATAAFGSVVVL